MKIPSVLHNKQFIKLWISQMCTVTGLNIVNFVLLLRLFDRTGSTLAASFLWISYSLPILLVGPIAATVVDIVNKKRLLTITTLLQALTILLFLFTGDRYFLLYAIMFIYSLFSQFYLPSESATLPNLVRKEDLPEANGMFLLTKQAGMLIGYGSAGFLTLLLGFQSTIILCSSLLALACISVISLPTMKAIRKINVEQDLAQFFSKVGEGYLFIKNNKSILYPVLLVAGSEMIMLIVAINMPALARDILHIRIENAATYIIIPALTGALAGVMLFPKLLKQGLRKKTIIKTALLILAFCFLAIGLLLNFLPIPTRLWMLPILCLVAGFCFIGVEIPAQTFMQESTPPEMMGRLWGNLWFMSTIATIAPMFLSASITEFLGVDTFFVILGIVIFIAWFYAERQIKDHSMEPIKEE